MRKRLKKKYELGPYKRFGFDVTGQFDPGADKEKITWDLYDFLAQYEMSGSIGYQLHNNDFDWYIDVGTRKMKPTEQKNTVIDWLKKRNDLLSFESNKLHDFNDKAFYQ